MTVSGPKVRDFTDRERALPVTVDADPIYEVILALFVIHGGTEIDEYEDGSTLIEQLEAHAGDSLRSDLDALGSCGELWLPLLGIASDLPSPRTVGDLADALEAMNAVELRRILLRNVGIKPSRGYDEADVAGAAAGESDAVERVFADGHHDPALRRLMDLEPDETARFLASILRRVGAATADWQTRVRPLLQRDAASTRSMARTMNPARLVEKATNGITFEMQPQVSGILLIPSVIIRPWVVISEHGTLRVFCYPIADEILEGDLDAPPVYMVEMFKALGDERRLRILGVLAEGDAGLKEIADRVDLAKSTAHHHLRILRSAGLVRVTISDDDKRYGLRRETVPEVSRLLEGFLHGQDATHERKDTA